jgi:peptidyl-tRNA hydrolase, PTH1 family
MWLLVGLGNPGAKYLLTRHNIGFMLVDLLAKDQPSSHWKSELQALTLKLRWIDQDVLLVKPQTFMNLSGQSVRALMDYYKIYKDHIIVAHDEIDQPFGALKIQHNRGAAGHNGIKSLHEHLGHSEYIRLRLGVGRPPKPGPDVASYVLQNFSNDEQNRLGEFLEQGLDAAEEIIQHGWEKAANKFNTGV